MVNPMKWLLKACGGFLLLLIFSNDVLANPIGFVYTISDDSFESFTYPGSWSTKPDGINDAGQIVGTYEPIVGVFQRGFVKDGNVLTVLDYPGSYYTDLHDINNVG
jgi:hypothetical protein